MPLNRGPFNALIDDNGTNTTGTKWNKAQIQAVILDPVDAALATAGGVDSCERLVVTAGGNVTPALNPARFVHLVDVSNTATTIILGFSGGAQANGERVVVRAVGTAAVFISQGDGTAARNCYNYITSAPTPLGLYGTAEYVYDGTAWVLVAHTQGGPIVFNPTLAFGGASVGLVYGARFASYTVSGIQVKVTGRITLAGKGSSVGAASIGALPYTVNATYYSLLGFPYFSGWQALPAASSHLQAFFNPNTPTAALYTPNNGAMIAISDTHATAGADVVFDGTYLTS
jgi:hypothetical protein